MAHQADEIAFSIDEMTGIQALERIAADLPMSPGKPVAREFEYKRNGTQTLIAAMNIALGKITAHWAVADMLGFLRQLGVER